ELRERAGPERGVAELRRLVGHGRADLEAARAGRQAPAVVLLWCEIDERLRASAPERRTAHVHVQPEHADLLAVADALAGGREALAGMKVDDRVRGPAPEHRVVTALGGCRADLLAAGNRGRLALALRIGTAKLDDALGAARPEQRGREVRPDRRPVA